MYIHIIRLTARTAVDIYRNLCPRDERYGCALTQVHFIYLFVIIKWTAIKLLNLELEYYDHV